MFRAKLIPRWFGFYLPGSREVKGVEVASSSSSVLNFLRTGMPLVTSNAVNGSRARVREGSHGFYLCNLCIPRLSVLLVFSFSRSVSFFPLHGSLCVSATSRHFCSKECMPVGIPYWHYGGNAEFEAAWFEYHSHGLGSRYGRGCEVTRTDIAVPDTKGATRERRRKRGTSPNVGQR